MSHQLIGHHGDTTSHYDPLHQEWIMYQEPSVPGWHRKLVFDTFVGQVLSLGHNGGSSALWRYSPTSILWEKVTTRNQPFPANGAAMAYDTHQHILLYLANDSPNQYYNPSGKSVTFVYSSESQMWKRLPVPSPALYGMNYLTQYVPVHGVFLHFEKAPDSNGRIAVWAFRYHDRVLTDIIQNARFSSHSSSTPPFLLPVSFLDKPSNLVLPPQNAFYSRETCSNSCWRNRFNLVRSGARTGGTADVYRDRPVL